MKKLFVCDFDGTIYNNDNPRHLITVLNEFKRLEKCGNGVIIASGRPLHLLKPFFEDFDKRYFISNDGALFSKGFDIILEYPVSKTKLKIKTEKIKNDFAVYGQCISYVKSSNTSLSIKLNRFYNGHVERIESIDEIAENIYKVVFFGNDADDDFIEKCWNSYGISEYVACGVNKGACLKEVMKLSDFHAESIIAIGDGKNDISMFKNADRSFAVISAEPVVKASADKTAADVLNILRGDIL